MTAHRVLVVDDDPQILRALRINLTAHGYHVLLGGPVGAATGAPFRVKAHGSELEYSMRGRPELEARLSALAGELG